MRGILTRLNQISLILLTGICLRSDSIKDKFPLRKKNKNPPLAFVESNPKTNGVAALCSGASNPPSKSLEISEQYASRCFLFTKATIFIAERHGLFKSNIWKDFEKIMAPLSDKDLIGFGGISSENSPLLECNLATYRSKFVIWPFKDLRQMLIFRVFINVVGMENLQRSVSGHYSIDKMRLKKDVDIFKRLNSKVGEGAGVYILYRPSQFMHVENIEGVKHTKKSLDRNFGKWEIVTDTLENAVRIAEALLPCFSTGQLSILKFDLNPMNSIMNKTFRIIVYTSDRNSSVRNILRQITNKRLLWIYERQSYEGMILQMALFKFLDAVIAEKEKELSIPELEKVLAQVEDRDFMRSLGLSEFQRQVLLKALFLYRHKNLADPTTYTAHDMLRNLWLTWQLLHIALQPENQIKFKVYLKKIREKKMSVFMTQ